MDKEKILIVDDDENIAELISLYLNKECYETQIAADGASALEAFVEFMPNLILLDVMLPGMDGYQVCTEIRKQSNVPIIMLSAKGEVFDKVLGLKIGADDYIVNPLIPTNWLPVSVHCFAAATHGRIISRTIIRQMPIISAPMSSMIIWSLIFQIIPLH